MFRLIKEKSLCQKTCGWLLTGENGKIKFPGTFGEILEYHLPGRPIVDTYKKFNDIFTLDKGLWDCPLLLLID